MRDDLTNDPTHEPDPDSLAPTTEDVRGEVLPIEEGPPRPGQARARRGKRSGVPLWVGIIGVLLFFFCMYQVVSLVFTMQSINSTMSRFARPVALVTQFYDDMKSHSYDAAHSRLAPDLAGKLSPDDLRTQWQAFEAGTSAINVRIELPGSNQSQDTLTALLTRIPGNDYRVRLTVQDIAGQIRITAADPALVPR